jgi:hypothetical protein
VKGNSNDDTRPDDCDVMIKMCTRLVMWSCHHKRSDWCVAVHPLDVRLLGENQPLSAASEYEVACQSSGARPPANISWWKAGQLLDHTRETVSTLCVAVKVAVHLVMPQLCPPVCLQRALLSNDKNTLRLNNAAPYLEWRIGNWSYNASSSYLSSLDEYLATCPECFIHRGRKRPGTD